MSQQGEAAEQVVNMATNITIKGVECVTNLAGKGAMSLAAFLIATLKDQKKTQGKARVRAFHGKPTKVFVIKAKDMLDNRYALLFIRGERAVQDDKYDILKHPNIELTVDGGAARYVHGIAPHAFDLEDIILDADFEDYEILSEAEVNQFYENKEENKNEGK